jgi:hypothetical protein
MPRAEDLPVSREAVSRALEWLEPRLSGAPGELGRAVRECLRLTADAVGGGADDAAGKETASAGDGADAGTGHGAPDGASGDGPAPAPSVATVLARCALEELDRVVDRPDDRDVAVRLLAADASLTWAFEAAAETGEDVARLADAVGLRGEIGRRLEGTAGSGDGPGGAAGSRAGDGPPADGAARGGEE